MKLSDIKKLKVAELRSRLQELHLDSKGLKAELVGRLWSAIEAEETGQHNEEELITLQHENSGTHFKATDTVHVHTSSPTQTEVIEPTCIREYTDSATQTESKTESLPIPQQGSELISEFGSECQTVEEEEAADPEEDRRAQASSEDRRAQASSEDRRAQASSEDRRAQASSEDRRAQASSEDRRAQASSEDRRAQASSEDRGRGRAFYEFKEEIRYKRAKSPQPLLEREQATEEDENRVRLNPGDCHLHFEAGPDGACGQPRFWERFPLLWSGCRLTHGVRQGRVGFEVRLERKLLTSQLGNDADADSYGLRVGWSMGNSSVLLGEDKVSFAYDSRGKKVSGGKEEDFGERFSEGDIIGCYASFSTDGVIELSFHRNGRFMGAAFNLSSSVLLGDALYPHVLCKSCSFRLHLDHMDPPWYPGPLGFTPLASLSRGQRVRTTMASDVSAQYEVLLMVGLPGSGKTHWARAHMKQHPEKQYRLLSTEELLACMISGGQSDIRLQQASQCLTEMIKMAAQTPGKYILDQCNILFSARRYKLQLFSGFRRRVVVVFPSAEEWRRRLSKHQTSDEEQIPETALLKQQASCSLPEQHSELLEDLLYVELPQEQAQTLLQEYKFEARRLLPPIPKQEKKKPRLHKKRPYPSGPQSSHRWTRHYGWSNMTAQPWRQQPAYWTVGYRDQNAYSREFCDVGYKANW
ncbi:heterogeneous nuclear ribonucleoprotein U-like protein 2 isoform X2 [Notolabrus celidotus]|uniref:heterogeneous nuclear ribonucleoprotein U-like protein 2 isoform X2 n=1 Tax=Notolabrus celidotus TaxID=1203425 RepID=UPI00148FFA28|nr:heterogeneous nuclear ribonucleoprotein U-like protein 2 isoform X2 [Notolabrus celidotus]